MDGWMREDADSGKAYISCIPLQIEDGEMRATIDEKEGMVSFHSNLDQYNSQVAFEEQVLGQ